MSTITIVGNLTREPELRFTPSGIAVANFSVAVNKKKGEEETVSFFDCQAWREQAENVSELPKGCRVIVTGTPEQRSWENAEGEKRSKFELNAWEVGPSLRWATAVVTKNERSDGGSSRPASSGGSRRSSQSSGGGYGYDEEPF